MLGDDEQHHRAADVLYARPLCTRAYRCDEGSMWSGIKVTHMDLSGRCSRPGEHRHPVTRGSAPELRHRLVRWDAGAEQYWAACEKTLALSCSRHLHVRKGVLYQRGNPGPPSWRIANLSGRPKDSVDICSHGQWQAFGLLKPCHTYTHVARRSLLSHMPRPS